MRIRKVSQPSALPLDTAQVVDSYSASATDAYSANYINENFGYNLVDNGSEVKTGIKYNGDDVFVKRFYWDSPPDNSDSSKNLGFSLSDVNIYKIEGIAYTNAGNVLNIPFGDEASSSSATITFRIMGNNSTIKLTTHNSSFTNGKAYVNVYYTYK